VHGPQSQRSDETAFCVQQNVTASILDYSADFAPEISLEYRFFMSDMSIWAA